MNKIKDFLSNKKIMRILIILYGLLLIILHFTRIFDNSFWGDEVYSIRLANMSLSDLVNATAHDIHPPLYYMILKFFILILGNAGWVYHLVSLIPFIMMVVVCSRIIYDDFNPWTSLITLTLCGTLYSSLYNIMEVRDYEWAALWMLLAAIYYLRILNFQKCPSNLKRNMILFTIYALLAAYTFYYCIIALSVMYIGLMIHAIKNKALLKKVIIIWASTFIIYLPWCITFFSTLENNQNKIFKVSDPDIMLCINFIFSSKFSYFLLTFLLLSIVFILIYSKDNVYKYWNITCLLAFIMTILVPLIIGFFKTPMLFYKHLYPCAILLWLLLACNITKLPLKPFFISLIIILTVPFGLLSIKTTISDDKVVRQKLAEFLNVMKDISPENDIIITNEDTFSPGTINYYFPHISTYLYDGTKENNELITNTKASTVWIIDVDDLDNGGEMRKYCEDLGYKGTQLFDNGFFGNHISDIWQYTK
ncbi:MAG: hypothetical protein MJ133_01595 [Lachnospiraceae bacterium]|nr:hypothetical protein [Lachnospiraceae bacterium]